LLIFTCFTSSKVQIVTQKAVVALLNCEPKEDFGGHDSAHHGHADPNLAHARALCDMMGVAKDGSPVTGQVFVSICAFVLVKQAAPSASAFVLLC
jgi:hypothetical protein